jgi:murein DD-endopeptidase MepM/ murein hydrolase activator NlpD
MNIAYPLSTKRQINSKYGERNGEKHNGVDIEAYVGTNVIAITDGVVARADNNDSGGYGNFICIEHPDLNGSKKFSCYAHLSKMLKSVGDPVNQGDIIGLSGGKKGAQGSGDSSGPHLHFEIRNSLDGGFEDPTKYVTGGVVGLKSSSKNETKKLKKSVASTKFFKDKPIKIISTPAGHAKRSTKDWSSNNAYDIQANIGTKLYSLTSGRVTKKHESSNKKGNIFGTQLSITGTNGFPSIFYTHIKNVKLNVGDTVSPGDYIGEITEWPLHPESSHVHVGIERGHDVFDYMDKNGNIKNIKDGYEATDDSDEDVTTDQEDDDGGLFSNFKNFTNIISKYAKKYDTTSEKEKAMYEEVDRMKDIMKKIL